MAVLGRLACGVTALALVVVGVGSPVATAAEPPPTFSADPLSTWQTNGAVWALESIGGVVYVGGSFTKVRPPGTSPGSSQEVSRANFAAFDAATGALLSCAPAFTFSGGTPSVRALEESPDGSRLYVGGRFSSAAGTGVANLVALNPSTCGLLPTSSFRRPNVSSTIRAISATSSAVYFGGDFSSVDSQTRTRFAMLTSAGTLTSAAPAFNEAVRAILAAPDVGKVFVGGFYTTVNGGSNRGLVAVHPTSGSVVQSFPGWIPANSAVQALTRDDAGRFFVGAQGSGFGVFDGRIAADLATGAMIWKDYCLGAVQTVVAYQGVLYSGHHNHECQLTPGGWFEDGFRQHFTAQDIETKEILPTFLPDTNDGAGVAPQGPRAMIVAGGRLWAGGEFTTVNEAAQQGLTRFGTADVGAVSPPNLTVTPLQAGANLVSWLASLDRDDDALTYTVTRNNVVIHTVTARSRDWMRRTMSFVDDGATPGQTASYRIRVSEPDGGNTGPNSAAFSVQTRTQDELYAGAVLADEPSIYWRLDETTEQDARTRTGDLYYRARMWDSSGNGRQGTAERGYNSPPVGYTLGGPSALESGIGSSINLVGTTGRVAASFGNDDVPAQAAPNDYSVEFWFRSTSGSGGRLAGFGNRRTDVYERVQPGTSPPVLVPYTSTTSDRQVYLTNAGNLIFGKFASTTRVTVKSPLRYNNGAWHHVVATSGSAGMRLYVDGSLVASNANTGNRAYTGYWRVGTDTLSGWTERPTNNGISGGVDEFAVYDHQLSSGRVVAHYAAGRPSAGIDLVPPSAPGTPNAVVNGASVGLTWGAATDDIGVAGYDIHRGTDPGFTPTPANLVGTATGTSFTEVGVPAGDWSYRVVARDAQGNLGPPSGADSVTVEPQPVTETVVVTAEADTYVHASLATTNFGSGHNMTVDGDPYQAAYARFALPAAPAGTVLISASLRVRTTVNSFSGSVDPVSVELAESGWSESTMTYNTRADIPGPLLGTLPAGSPIATTFDVPLSAAPLRTLLGADASVALTMAGADSFQVDTRESSGQKPQLVLQFAED